MGSARKDQRDPRRPPAPEQQRAARAQQEQAAETLVLLSRIFAGIGGALLLFGFLGCVIGGAPFGGLLGGLALLVLVVAAILGQVGRGMQGRVI